MTKPALHRDASGRLHFSHHDSTPSEFGSLCQQLVRSFGLSPDGELITDAASILFREYRRGAEAVELAWDNWLGFTVTATTEDAEPLVEQIASFLLGGEFGDRHAKSSPP